MDELPYSLYASSQLIYLVFHTESGATYGVDVFWPDLRGATSKMKPANFMYEKYLPQLGDVSTSN